MHQETQTALGMHQGLTVYKLANCEMGRCDICCGVRCKSALPRQVNLTLGSSRTLSRSVACCPPAACTLSVGVCNKCATSNSAVLDSLCSVRNTSSSPWMVRLLVQAAFLVQGGAFADTSSLRRSAALTEVDASHFQQVVAFSVILQGDLL